MGKIIAITNQKGGVGKTTTAINLGAALALSGRKTLIIDFDPQGNASTGLGIDPSSRGRSSYDILVENMSIEDAVQTTNVEKWVSDPTRRYSRAHESDSTSGAQHFLTK